MYHGVSVTESYRWLEQGSDAKVKAWSAAQNRRTRQYLDALPWRKGIYDRLFAMASASSISSLNIMSTLSAQLLPSSSRR